VLPTSPHQDAPKLETRKVDDIIPLLQMLVNIQMTGSGKKHSLLSPLILPIAGSFEAQYNTLLRVRGYVVGVFGYVPSEQKRK
jgi:hypothetical protein